MSGIEVSFRDTISYMNENISDAMRGIKSSLNSTVNGIPFPAIGLSIFTITVLGVMVANSDGNPESKQEQEIPVAEPEMSEEQPQPEVSEEPQEAIPITPSEAPPSEMIEPPNSEEQPPIGEQPEQPPSQQQQQPPVGGTSKNKANKNKSRRKRK